MKHYLFNGSETPDEIRRVLLDNCEGTEDKTVMKRLTEDELIELREEFTETTLEIGRHDDALADARAAHKEAVKPLKESKKQVLQTLKSKHKEVSEKVYRLPNFETGFMEYVNLEGEVVETRRLRPEEKQGRLTPFNRAVNE